MRDVFVCKLFVNFGNEGKYILIDNGLIVVSVFNIRIIYNLFVFIGLYILWLILFIFLIYFFLYKLNCNNYSYIINIC